MKILRWLCLLLMASPCLAQMNGPFYLTHTSTTCATIGTFDKTASVGINVSGTWTGTLVPQGTIQGQTAFTVQVTPSDSATPASSITANGAYVAATAGLSTFQICPPTATGTAVIYLNGSLAWVSAGQTAAGSAGFADLTSGTNTTAAMHVGTGASLNATGSGTITATAVPWSGVSSTPTTISGYGISDAVVTDPSAGQTVTNATANGILFQNLACASLSSNITQNAGCSSVYNGFIQASSATTQTNLRRALNVYYQGNAQQGATDYYTAQFNGGIVTDANSVAGATFHGIDSNASVSGSNVSVTTLYAFDARPRIYNNATVSHLTYFHGAPTGVVPAGATVTTLKGLDLSIGVAGTVTNSAFLFTTANTWQYGLQIGGATRAGILDDSTSARSGLCHGTYTAAAVGTEHDCWMNGNGSPETAVTGNIGSTYARLDGGPGTTLYLKRSGTGNSGWVALTAVFPATLTTTAATSDNVSLAGMLSGGHCSLAPTNASAAADLGAGTTYISAKTTDQITVTHAVVSGETFDILCTAN